MRGQVDRLMEDFNVEVSGRIFTIEHLSSGRDFAVYLARGHEVAVFRVPEGCRGTGWGPGHYLVCRLDPEAGRRSGAHPLLPGKDPAHYAAYFQLSGLDREIFGRAVAEILRRLEEAHTA